MYSQVIKSRRPGNLSPGSKPGPVRGSCTEDQAPGHLPFPPPQTSSPLLPDVLHTKQKRASPRGSRAAAPGPRARIISFQADSQNAESTTQGSAANLLVPAWVTIQAQLLWTTPADCVEMSGKE